MHNVGDVAYLLRTHGTGPSGTFIPEGADDYESGSAKMPSLTMTAPTEPMAGPLISE